MGSKVIDVPNVGSVEFPDSMSDDQISTAIKGTYFSGKSKGYTPQPGDASISAAPTGAKAWLSNLETDFRQGTTNTFPGKILSAMGAQGVDRGAQAGTVDSNLMTPVLGPIHTAQGIAETPDHPVRGPLKAIGGALETMTLPASFMAPEANMGLDKIPSKSYAGEMLGRIKAAAGASEVDPNAAGQVALQTQKLAESGGQMPKVVKDFLKRVTDPAKPPLSFAEARDFYSNATRLSADEFNKMTGPMKRQIGQFTEALGGSIQDAATKAGYGDEFSSAMQEFRRASQISGAVKAGAKFAGKSIAAGTVGYGTYELVKAIARGGR